MRFLIAFLLASVLSINPKTAYSDTIYPQGGPLSKQNTDAIEFRSFDCDAQESEKKITCSQSLTLIEPKLPKLKTTEELKEIAARDGFDIDTLIGICEVAKPAFDFSQDKPIDGKTVTAERLKAAQEKLAAQGFGTEFIPSFIEICEPPSEMGIIRMLDQMQLAESKICTVSLQRIGEADFDLDENTGTFIRSKKVNGVCDQFIRTEVIFPLERSISLIGKFVDKKTFIQKIAKGEKRETFHCDNPEFYEDQIFVFEKIYFPLKCESFVRR